MRAFGEQLKDAHDERKALIAELRYAMTHLGEVLGNVKDSHVSKWHTFERLVRDRTLSSQFEAGRIFGEVLLEVLSLVGGGVAAIKAVSKIPNLAKLARSKIPTRPRRGSSGAAESVARAQTPSTPSKVRDAERPVAVEEPAPSPPPRKPATLGESMGKHARPAEQRTAKRLADRHPEFNGRTFEAPPPPDPGYDWIDDLGRTYDAMGDGTQAGRFRLDQFTRAIDKHLRKSNDFTVVDMTGYKPEQDRRCQAAPGCAARRQAGDDQKGWVLMLSISFDSEHEWWVSGKIFERLFQSALDRGMSPKLEQWRDVANANGGLDLTLMEPGEADELMTALRSAAERDLTQLGAADPASEDGSYRVGLLKLLDAMPKSAPS
jgi:hypothetical protein